MLKSNYGDLAGQFREVLLINIEYLKKINSLENEVQLLKSTIAAIPPEAAKPIFVNPYPDILKIITTPMDAIRFIDGAINDPLHYMCISTVAGIFIAVYYYSASILEEWNVSHDKNKPCYNENGIPVVQRGYEHLIEEENEPVIDLISVENIVEKEPEKEEQFDISYFFDPKHLSFFE